MVIPEKRPNETTRKALAEKDLITFETPEGMSIHGGLEDVD